MFDNLRETADSSFYEEELSDLHQGPAPEKKPVFTPQPRSGSNTRFLGLTPQQRFILAVMLMLTVCIMGTLAMFVTEKMSLF
jgi:hypothetical protein